MLDADGRKLTLAGLSPMGLRLFLLTYEDGRITAEKLPALPASLPPPAQVLADIMLAWWPLESWAPRLPAGWTLADDSPARRVLRDPDGNPVAEIHYRETGPAAAPRRADPVLVRHHSFGYEIRLTTLTDD
ncbi:DUF3261 domain-containing protein [Opitutaceae bacterium TAV4]|nr:DUF3261 domain-containing protein [Opitutaceae bacterium TAV4]